MSSLSCAIYPYVIALIDQIKAKNSTLSLNQVSAFSKIMGIAIVDQTGEIAKYKDKIDFPFIYIIKHPKNKYNRTIHLQNNILVLSIAGSSFKIVK